MTEAFACGTAAVITPIGRIKARSGSFTMGDQQSGPVTTHLRQALLDLQHGLAPDPHRWMHRVC
jgi:branched-chain amino acid aminotransferase